MYESRSRLKSHQQGELLKMFVVGATARAAAEVVGVHRNTAAVFFMPLRKFIASKLPSYELSGEVEADESYFGGIRVRENEDVVQQAKLSSASRRGRSVKRMTGTSGVSFMVRVMACNFGLSIQLLLS